jgi:hypothetical protein
MAGRQIGMTAESARAARGVQGVCKACSRGESAVAQTRSCEHALARERERKDDGADEESGFAARAAERRGQPVERDVQPYECERMRQSVPLMFATG